MIQPSPAPRLPPRRIWPWIVGVIAVLAVVLIALGATYPWWAAGRARAQLIGRLAARTDGPVEIDRLTLDYDAVHVSGLRLGDGAGRVELDRVDVSLERAALWRGRVRPVEIVVDGGRVWGTERGLADLARKLRGRDEDQTNDEGPGRGRISMRPQRLEVTGVGLDISFDDGADSEGRAPRRGRVPIRRIVGAVDASWNAVHERLQVQLGSVEATLAAGRAAKATSLSTAVSTRSDAERFPLTIEVRDASTSVTPEIAVGKVTGKVTIFDAVVSEVEVALDGGFADERGEGTGELWSMAGKGRRDLSSGEVRLAMAAFELGRVPQVLERLPLVESEDATVGGAVRVKLSDGKIDISGEVEVDGLNVQHPLLASNIVHDVGFGLEFGAAVYPDASRLELQHATVRRGDVAVDFSGSFVHPPERTARRYLASVKMDRTDCQSVLDALPGELVPGLRDFRLGGKMDTELKLAVDFSDLDALELSGGVGIDGCSVLATPVRATPNRLAGSFNHVVRMKNGGVRTVHLHQGSPDYTPYDYISPNMVSAVLTTEDGGFWRHNGFLPSQFEEALRRNLRAGRVRLGASTITMQLVKNVLLSHERTLSRKLQELFLTWYVERTLDKRRLMEIYLNVIEFGPGVYGVTNAARYYFGKHPSALNSLEAAYLTLMLPNPVGRHGMYCRGELTPSFVVKLRRIHGLMHSRGRISDEEYLMWKDADLVFDPRSRGSESQCLARSHVQMEATGVQIPLSGLLVDGARDAVDDDPPPLMPRREVLPDVDDDVDDASDEPGAADDFDPGLTPEPIPAMDQLEALHEAEAGQ